MKVKSTDLILYGASVTRYPNPERFTITDSDERTYIFHGKRLKDFSNNNHYSETYHVDMYGTEESYVFEVRYRLSPWVGTRRTVIESVSRKEIERGLNPGFIDKIFGKTLPGILERRCPMMHKITSNREWERIKRIILEEYGDNSYTVEIS